MFSRSLAILRFRRNGARFGAEHDTWSGLGGPGSLWAERNQIILFGSWGTNRVRLFRSTCTTDNALKAQSNVKFFETYTRILAVLTHSVTESPFEDIFFK